MTATVSTSPEPRLTAADLASCGYQQAIARGLVEQCAAMERPTSIVDATATGHPANAGE